MGGRHMRIVGGRFRGRRLRAPEGGGTRPTSEKVREALFDVLGPRVEGALFLDLFAGTGAVGFEAISRGARGAVFVESGRDVQAVLRANAQALGLSPPVFRLLPVPAAKGLAMLGEEGYAPDVAFCDPPYADEAWPRLLAAMATLLNWREGRLLVVEHAAKRPPECPLGFTQGRTYTYGDTGMTVFERAEGRGPRTEGVLFP